SMESSFASATKSSPSVTRFTTRWASAADSTTMMRSVAPSAARRGDDPHAWNKVETADNSAKLNQRRRDFIWDTFSLSSPVDFGVIGAALGGRHSLAQVAVDDEPAVREFLAATLDRHHAVIVEARKHDEHVVLGDDARKGLRDVLIVPRVGIEEH